MRESTTESPQYSDVRGPVEKSSLARSVFRKRNVVRSAVGLALLLLLPSAVARAQTPPDAPPPAPMDAPPPPPAMPEPPAAMPPPPPPMAAPSAVEAAPKPPTATETMPATRPDALPPIDVGAWVRTSGIFQSNSDKSKLNDFHFDNSYVELHAGGKIHKNVGVTLNLNANMTNFSSAAVAVEDAIISFDFANEFHVWAGHLLVPVDRSNASGPFFMIPWNYPGLPGAGPHEGPSGRNNGAVVWGDVGGKLTYLLGVFDNGDVNTSPLYSGRLRLSLLDSETGFWGNGSFFGDKDIFTIGVGGQLQKHGSTTTDVLGIIHDKDYGEFNADALFEKKIPGGGWFTAEAAYYYFNVNDGAINNYFYGLLAYATPTIGVGNIQPMVRYQWEKIKSGTGTNPWNIDAALSYLIKGPALRVVATYSHTQLTEDAMTGLKPKGANSIQLGAQAIFF